MADDAGARLTPLSNDPESLTDFASTIGLEPSSFQFAEIFSFEPELLAMIPKPVYSTIFLYPINKAGGFLEERHQERVPLEPPVPWFSFQTVNNACGTIAVIHSALNNLDRLAVRGDSWLGRFIEANGPGTTPEQHAFAIEHSSDLLEVHEVNATDDTTPILEDSGWNHFITFVLVGGRLWELDGRKPQPISHGPCQDLLNGSLEIVKRDFHPHVPDVMATSMVAFCGISEE
jgi:hypothetical protein